jgi:hypothetical protein
LKGRIWNLNNKEPKSTQYNRWLSFGLQTNKDNSIFLQVGDRIDSSLTIKVKGEGMEQVEEVNEQDAIARVKELFKDGDSVYINARINVNPYFKNVSYLVNQIYIEKEPIDFNSEDFEETNELKQTVIITEKPSDKSIKVGLTTFKGEMVEQELKLLDDDVNDYFVENAKVGDVMRLTISINRKPNYIDGGEESTSTRKTLKGKTVTTGSKRIIDKNNPYTEYLEVVDVDLEKTEKQRYTRDEIREALEKSELTKTKKSETNNNNSAIEEDDSLPY